MQRTRPRPGSRVRRTSLVTLDGVEPGSVLERKNQADEYMIILPPGVDATVEAGSVKIDGKGDSLFIAPPGASKITAKSKGLIARIITTKAVDLVEKAHNKAIYADGAPEITPIKYWPDPVRRLQAASLRHVEAPRPEGPAHSAAPLPFDQHDGQHLRSLLHAPRHDEPVAALAR